MVLWVHGVGAQSHVDPSHVECLGHMMKPWSHGYGKKPGAACKEAQSQWVIDENFTKPTSFHCRLSAQHSRFANCRAFVSTQDNAFEQRLVEMSWPGLQL